MPNPVYVGDLSSGKIYKIGRIGFDSGTADPAGAFTGTMRTEKHSPAGPEGLCLFRRVYIRVHHTGGFTIIAKAYVDGVQTKINLGTNQTTTFVQAAPATSPAETVLEMAIEAQGTSIEVEMTTLSDTNTGILLIEEITIGHFPIRESKSRSGTV
jgi:hypothetical protein